MVPVEPVLGCPDCCSNLEDGELGRWTIGLRLNSEIPGADAGGGGGLPPTLSSSSESSITFLPAIDHCLDAARGCTSSVTRIFAPHVITRLLPELALPYLV